MHMVYMSVQAIACSMGLPKKMEPNQVPILETLSQRVSRVVANGGAYLECAPRGAFRNALLILITIRKHAGMTARLYSMVSGSL